MFNSNNYWENRYKEGGNSGEGSYNALAEFKASVINNFIIDNNILSIIDYGVGDGNQLTLLDTTNRLYYGVDISPTIINKCKLMFAKDDNKHFVLSDDLSPTIKADLVLSCDVLYHLIEDSVYYNYMKELFNRSEHYVIIYAKNDNINHTTHVKFRRFTDYIEHTFTKFKLITHIPNKFPQLHIGRDNHKTSPSDFYIYKKI
jgi:hypothetical protein